MGSETSKTVIPAPAKGKVVTFSASNAVIGSNGREDKAAKTRRLVADLIRTPLTFLGQVGEEHASELCNGDSLDFGPLGKVSLSNLASLRCPGCGGVNGAPKTAEDKRNNEWNADRLQLAEFYSQNGKLVLWSNTCVRDYIKTAVESNPASVTNAVDFARVHGLSIPKAK